MIISRLRQNKILRTSLLARLPHLYFGAAWTVLRLLSFLPFFYLRPNNTKDTKPCTAIEAGEKGWSSIEMKELVLSAAEFVGEPAVCKLVIDREKPYAKQVRLFLDANRVVTHYLYDPRAGRAEAEQTYLNCFTDSLKVAITLARRRITPIAYLTDASYRKWRCQASVVTSVSGGVTMFMCSEAAKPMLPHRRFFGPAIMPLSLITFRNLQGLRSSLVQSNAVENIVRFSGSVYEPRATFLKQFETELREKCDIQGRYLGSARRPEDWYWRNLASAAIVITTADQIEQDGADFPHIQQLVYRCTEALAAGALLLAPDVPGMRRYYEPGKHFVAFDSIADACAKANFYLENTSAARRIAEEGHKRAEQLVKDHIFWKTAVTHTDMPVG
jgi:hypothetical protein